MKPRLKPFINIVRDDETTCCFMISERELFRCRGKSVPLLLDQVLPLMDGERTVEALAAKLEGTLPAKAVQDLVTLLVRNHVVMDAEEEAPAAGAPGVSPAAYPGLMTFLARFSDRPGALWSRLRRARVAVVGDSPLLTEVTAALASCAIGAIDVVAPPELAGAGLAEVAGATTLRRVGLDRMGEVVPGADLVIGVQDGEFCFGARLKELNRMCLEVGQSWLHLRLTLEGEAWIGPVYAPGSACFECLTCRLQSNLKSWKENAQHERRIAEGQLPEQRMDFLPFRQQLAQAAAVETVKFLTGIDGARLISHCLVLDLLSQESSLHTVLRYPRCPACSRLQTGRIYPWDEDELKLERMLIPRPKSAGNAAS
ncbi:MAG TPA: TOMM precursor leader peptide-binding protein [Polyangia bacterium]|nr:TOMM precursor leader peptide-binding protein [Polyangia bacterium]